MKIEITNKLILHKSPKILRDELIDRLTFDNPKWFGWRQGVHYSNNKGKAQNAADD